MGTRRAFRTGMHLPNSEGPHQACSQGSSGQFQFIQDLPMQPSSAQMNRGTPGTPHTHSFVYMSDYSIDMLQQDKVDQSFSSQMSVPPMNRMAPENPQPDLFNHINDSSMTLIPQNPAGPTTLKKHPKRTSFMQTQHEQLEALFSYTMFPDKNLQKELALKLNLPELTIKTWFRNRRVKLRKEQQQQQLSLKQPNQILPAKNVPTSLTSSPSPYSLFPVVPDSHSFLPPQPLGPSNLAQDSVITESPTSDIQMQDPQLEGLEASIPALFPDTYTIEKIMELHSFSDEDEIYDSFHCLYQYLSPTDPS